MGKTVPLLMVQRRNENLSNNKCLTLNMHDVYYVHTFKPTYLWIIHSVNRYFKICCTHWKQSTNFGHNDIISSHCIYIRTYLHHSSATFQQSKDLSQWPQQHLTDKQVKTYLSIIMHFQLSYVWIIDKQTQKKPN